MYECVGDSIALQYAGSQLAHRMDTYQLRANWRSTSQDLLTSIRRYYNSTFTDSEKQCSMNLFLGKYIPAQQKIHLWLFPNDNHLHSSDQLPSYVPLSSTKWWEEPLSFFSRSLDFVSSFSLPLTQKSLNFDVLRSNFKRQLFHLVHKTSKYTFFDRIFEYEHNQSVRPYFGTHKEIEHHDKENPVRKYAK